MSKADDKPRCKWPGSDPLYLDYHDHEWGRPEYGDRALFEMLMLEGAQAGLSWITILRKRENYRRAFDGFDPVKINYELLGNQLPHIHWHVIPRLAETRPRAKPYGPSGTNRNR